MVNPFFAVSSDYKTKIAASKIKRVRVPFMKREKAAIIKLRAFGYSINELSIFSGRSASVIHRILHKNAAIMQTSISNLRKLRNQTRLLSAQKHRLTLERFMGLWEAFILGETDKPP